MYSSTSKHIRYFYAAFFAVVFFAVADPEFVSAFFTVGSTILAVFIPLAVVWYVSACVGERLRNAKRRKELEARFNARWSHYR